MNTRKTFCSGRGQRPAFSKKKILNPARHKISDIESSENFAHQESTPYMYEWMSFCLCQRGAWSFAQKSCTLLFELSSSTFVETTVVNQRLTNYGSCAECWPQQFKTSAGSRHVATRSGVTWGGKKIESSET